MKHLFIFRYKNNKKIFLEISIFRNSGTEVSSKDQLTDVIWLVDLNIFMTTSPKKLDRFTSF